MGFTMTVSHPAPSSYEAMFGPTVDLINSRLERYLTPEAHGISNVDEIEGPSRLWEALRYSALSGGKRIRPVLAVQCCLACGGNIESILPTACAIELVHAQSLIHDDLPCMDNDDLRRGKPTLHKAFDESTAVLSGDALLAMAFGLVTRETPLSEQVTTGKLLEVISEFSSVASVRGLVNGQYVDIHYEGKPFTAEVLEYIHTYKTGALFTFSVRVGALLAGAEPAIVDCFTVLGRKLGLAFQIVDDLLDIQSTSEMLGKTAGKDQVQQKATYPALYGESASREKVEVLVHECYELLECMAEGPSAVDVGALKVLTDFICHRIH